MNIDGLLRDLGPVGHVSLRSKVLALEPQIWRQNLVRQESFDVHKHTESIVLLFIEIDDWPKIVVKREAGWAHLADVAMPLIDDVVRAHYQPGGMVVRAVIARLAPGARIMPHTDFHPSLSSRTSAAHPACHQLPGTLHHCGKPYALLEGHAYEINNQKPHSVMNNGADGRIHFIFDYVPPVELPKVAWRAMQPGPSGPGHEPATFAHAD